MRLTSTTLLALFLLVLAGCPHGRPCGVDHPDCPPGYSCYYGDTDDWDDDDDDSAGADDDDDDGSGGTCILGGGG